MSPVHKLNVKMILAVEQYHKQGFIHRDIKPDVSIEPGFSVSL